MRLQLYKRGEVWWVRGSEGGVKFRRSTKHTSRALAHRVLLRWEREFADPTHHAAHRATVSSSAERFLRELKQSAKSSATVTFYEVKVRHVVRLLGTVTLANLTHERVVAYIARRTGEPPEGEGAAQYSVHRELTALRRILKSAARAREFGGDWKAIIPEYATGYEPLREWVTPEQVWAAIHKLPPLRGATVAFCIATAADRSSLWLARREDVRDRAVLVRGTKTKTRRREVPRVGVFDQFLRYAMEHAQPGEELFPEWDSMPRDMRAACRRAGVPEFTARTLRRSAATWMVQAGVPFEVAAKFLGHGSTAMLFRVYGQMATGDVGRLIAERMAVPVVYPDRTKTPDSAGAGEQPNTEKHAKEEAGDAPDRD